jgi:single-stranded-DNA-specific exonuclease
VRPAPDPARARVLSESLGIPPAGGALLLQRGVASPEEARLFLRPSPSGLSDPGTLRGMDRAVARIGRALRRGEKVVVHGDYDADGVCGAALLTTWLRRRGADAHVFLPDRRRDGYGLARRLVRRAGKVGVRLLISVDCGASDRETIGLARDLGIDVVVTDHHEMPGPLPEAAAVVNPRQDGETARFREYSGAGLAFKLVQALTLADVVSLLDENRILGWLGSRRIERTPRPGFAALCASSGLGRRRLSSYHVNFVLAPRLNAAGRVERAKTALDLLLTTGAGPARILADRLEELNRRRKELQTSATDGAVSRATELLAERDRNSLVLASADWDEGVIGITAARLVRRFGLPSVVIALSGETGKGSCRSVPGLPMVRALESSARHLVRFGGHQEAAGFTIRTREVDAFRETFARAVDGLLPGGRAEFVETADVRLPFDACSLRLAEFLEEMEPVGPGNPRPLFLAENVEPVVGTARVVGRGHLKAVFQDSGGGRLECIGFGMAGEVGPGRLEGGRWDLLFHLSRQENWAPDRVQGVLRGIRAA